MFRRNLPVAVFAVNFVFLQAGQPLTRSANEVQQQLHTKLPDATPAALSDQHHSMARKKSVAQRKAHSQRHLSSSDDALEAHLGSDGAVTFEAAAQNASPSDDVMNVMAVDSSGGVELTENPHVAALIDEESVGEDGSKHANKAMAHHGEGAASTHHTEPEHLARKAKQAQPAVTAPAVPPGGAIAPAAGGAVPAQQPGVAVAVPGAPQAALGPVTPPVAAAAPAGYVPVGAVPGGVPTGYMPAQAQPASTVPVQSQAQPVVPPQAQAQPALAVPSQKVQPGLPAQTPQPGSPAQQQVEKSSSNISVLVISLVLIFLASVIVLICLSRRAQQDALASRRIDALVKSQGLNRGSVYEKPSKYKRNSQFPVPERTTPEGTASSALDTQPGYRSRRQYSLSRHASDGGLNDPPPDSDSDVKMVQTRSMPVAAGRSQQLKRGAQKGVASPADKKPLVDSMDTPSQPPEVVQADAKI